MKKLLLIDASNFMFRAYYALPPLSTKDGRPTGAIRGFLSMLNTLRDDVQTDYVACVFDPKGKTFRSEIYPEYKANREATPEDLQAQIPSLFEAIEKLGVPLIQIPHYEADDTIGTIAKKAEKEGFKVVIATGDKDYAQLVDENVVLVNTMGKENTWMDTKGVKAKFDVYPNQIIDFLALMGDKIDNVPGVPKCGAKTAAKWLQTYGTLDNLIANVDEIKGAIGQNLKNSLGFLPIAKELVTIKTDANLAPDFESVEQLKVKPINTEELYEYYKRMEFRGWARELQKEIQTAAAKKDSDGEGSLDLFGSDFESTAPAASEPERALAEKSAAVIDSIEKAQKLAQRLLEQKDPVSFYVLHNGDDPRNFMPVGFSFGLSSGENFFIRISEAALLSTEGVTLDEFKEVFETVLTSEEIRLVGYDTKLISHVLANADIKFKPFTDDVQLQNYVLEAHKSHVLEKISDNWLEFNLGSEEELLGKSVKKKSFSDIEPSELCKFATDRSYCVFELSKLFKEILAKDEKLSKIYQDIEMPLSVVLFKMEQNGVLIDSDLLNKQTQELNEKMSVLEKQAYEAAGEEFKLSSPKQLGEILFNKLGAQIDGKKPKTGASGSYSTSEEVLQELAADYPLAKIALDYRSLSKLVTTYTDKLPRMVDPKDNRVHTTFEQAVAVTGRLSSTNPNLQNIPIRTEEGRKVREAFIAPQGSKIISADYSQIELRIMAHLSNDAGLVAAFKNHEDIHKATAAEVFSKPKDQVTPNDRRIAKVINFGLIYGMSAFGLAKNLGIDRQDAKNYIERYFHRYPGAHDYMESTRVSAEKNGYVETIFGRRLWLPEIHSSGMRKAAAQRAAINAPMQGTAADLIKLSMIAVQKWIEQDKLKSKLILQVHDELLMEVPDEEVELVKEKLPAIMDSVATLHVPLIAEVGVADNWEAAH